MDVIYIVLISLCSYTNHTKNRRYSGISLIAEYLIYWNYVHTLKYVLNLFWNVHVITLLIQLLAPVSQIAETEDTPQRVSSSAVKIYDSKQTWFYFTYKLLVYRKTFIQDSACPSYLMTTVNNVSHMMYYCEQTQNANKLKMQTK